MSYALVDLGFSQAGGTNCKCGCKKLLFGQFFPKNCMKLKEFGCACPWRPPPPQIRQWHVHEVNKFINCNRATWISMEAKFSCPKMRQYGWTRTCLHFTVKFNVFRPPYQKKITSTSMKLPFVVT